MKAMQVTLKKAMVLVSTVLLSLTVAVAADGVIGEVELVVKPVANTKKLIFGITKLNGQKTRVEIIDRLGDVVYRDSWNNVDEDARLFNFSKLEEGQYTLKVSVGQEVLSQELVINSENVVVYKEATAWKPRFNVSDQKVIVTFPNFDDENVSLKFYDKQGELIYEEAPETALQFAKRYNFAKKGTGSYSCVISKGGQTFSKTFYIQ